MKKEYKTGITSGERKIAHAILDKCDFKAVEKVKEEDFKGFLRVVSPSINKRIKADLAFKVMLRGGFIKAEKGEISLGEEGEKYLSP